MQQADVFVPTMTALESLLFIADLKLGPKYPKEQKLDIINKLSREAGLIHRLHVRVGK